MNAWHEFRNIAGETIPAFACLKITGVLPDEDEQQIAFRAEKPDGYGAQYRHMLNGPVEVPSGAFGVCTAAFPAWALYDGGGAPDPAGVWGPVAGSWSLHKNVGGFLSLGTGVDGRLLVVRAPLLQLRVTLDGELAHGGTAEASPFAWDGSTWTEDASHTVTVREAIGIDEPIEAGTVCWCVYEPTWDGFVVVSAECS